MGAFSGPVTAFHRSTGDGTMAARQEFYTWREAVLQACDVAALYGTVGKPRVAWVADRWVLTYRHRPLVMNASA